MWLRVQDNDVVFNYPLIYRCVAGYGCCDRSVVHSFQLANHFFFLSLFLSRLSLRALSA